MKELISTLIFSILVRTSCSISCEDRVRVLNKVNFQGKVFECPPRSVLRHSKLSTIFLVKDQQNQYFSLKVTEFDQPGSGFTPTEVRQGFRKEADVLASISSPSVIPFHLAFNTANYGFVLLKATDPGTLEDYIYAHLRDIENPEFILAIFLRLVEGTEAVHAANWIHTDLQLKNIVMYQGNPVITNFERAFPSESRRIRGPPFLHEDPMCRGIICRIDWYTDVYSLGIVLYRMVAGTNQPFHGEGKDLEANIDKGIYKLPLETNWAIGFIIMACLSKSPQTRPTIQELLKFIQYFLKLPDSIRRITLEDQMLNSKTSPDLANLKVCVASPDQPQLPKVKMVGNQIQVESTEQLEKEEVTQTPNSQSLGVQPSREVLETQIESPHSRKLTVDGEGSLQPRRLSRQLNDFHDRVEASSTNFSGSSEKVHGIADQPSTEHTQKLEARNGLLRREGHFVGELFLYFVCLMAVASWTARKIARQVRTHRASKTHLPQLPKNSSF